MDDLALSKAIGENPTDTLALLAMADWWEERGHLPASQHCLRWMVGRNRFPGKRDAIEKRPWIWVRQQKRYLSRTSKFIAECHPLAELPAQIFDAMITRGRTTDYSGGYADYAHSWDAINNLTDALFLLRSITSVKPLSKT